jgi:hypothetical protein
MMMSNVMTGMVSKKNWKFDWMYAKQDHDITILITNTIDGKDINYPFKLQSTKT